MDMVQERQRKLKLTQWAAIVQQNAANGAFLGEGFPIQVRAIPGPRAGVLEILAGIQSGPLMRLFQRDDHALLRQLVPWPFQGDPACFMSGRRVRIEAAWSAALEQSMIRLSDLGEAPRDGPNRGRWTVGKPERGARISTSLCDATPHWLFGGATGSGKTVALRGAALQLAGYNRLVLVDGKYGVSLKVCEGLPGVIGPVAIDVDMARAALGWTCTHMRQRFEKLAQGANVAELGRVVVCFDDFQTLTKDPIVAGLMARIATQGRAAGVSLIAATQHPIMDMFGDSTTAREMTGRLALSVTDAKASEVVIGGPEPRADHLMRHGDAYLVAPGHVYYRLQVAYVDEKDISKAVTGQPELERWPAYDPHDVGQALPARAAHGPRWKEASGTELGIATVAAIAGQGRDALKALFEEYELTRPGSGRAGRLLKTGREIWALVSRSPELRDYCYDRKCEGDR